MSLYSTVHKKIPPPSYAAKHTPFVQTYDVNPGVPLLHDYSLSSTFTSTNNTHSFSLSGNNNTSTSTSSLTPASTICTPEGGSYKLIRKLGPLGYVLRLHESGREFPVFVGVEGACGCPFCEGSTANSSSSASNTRITSNSKVKVKVKNCAARLHILQNVLQIPSTSHLLYESWTDVNTTNLLKHGYVDRNSKMRRSISRRVSEDDDGDFAYMVERYRSVFLDKGKNVKFPHINNTIQPQIDEEQTYPYYIKNGYKQITESIILPPCMSIRAPSLLKSANFEGQLKELLYLYESMKDDHDGSKAKKQVYRSIHSLWLLHTIFRTWSSHVHIRNVIMVDELKRVRMRVCVLLYDGGKTDVTVSHLMTASDVVKLVLKKRKQLYNLTKKRLKVTFNGSEITENMTMIMAGVMERSVLSLSY